MDELSHHSIIHYLTSFCPPPVYWQVCKLYFIYLHITMAVGFTKFEMSGCILLHYSPVKKLTLKCNLVLICCHWFSLLTDDWFPTHVIYKPKAYMYVCIHVVQCLKVSIAKLHLYNTFTLVHVFHRECLNLSTLLRLLSQGKSARTFILIIAQHKEAARTLKFSGQTLILWFLPAFDSASFYIIQLIKLKRH